jgi:hypothetical protein
MPERGMRPEQMARGDSVDLDTAPDCDPALTTPKVARVGPLAIRTRITSPVLQALVALGVYLAVWVTARVYPLVLHPAQPQLDLSAQDPNFFIWCLRWWPHAIAHGLNPIHTTEVLAPKGYDLAWITAIPALSLLITPLTAAAGPVVSYNLLADVSLPVSAWAAFVLCRRITRRFWPALLGGAVYGFSAYEMNHMTNGTLNLIFVPLLPLMVYLVVLWRDGKLGPRAFVGLLALAIVLQFYFYLEIFADMTAVGAVALLLGYALADRSSRRAVASLSRLVGLAYLLALVFVGPYIAYAVSHVPPGGMPPLGPSHFDLANLVVPGHGRQTFGLSWLARYSARMPIVSGGGYVGVPLLALAVALTILTWPRKLTRLLFMLLVFFVLVSLGPALYVGGSRVTRLPWACLWALPIVHSAWPVRFMLFSFLVLAVMVALWLAGPSKRMWARWMLGLLAMASVVVSTLDFSFSSGPNLPAFITTGEYRHYLAPGDTVVVVSQRGNAGMLWQAETNFYMRLAGGYINGAITHSDLPPPVAHLAHATRQHIRKCRLFLENAHVTAVLVEENLAPAWAGVLARLGLRREAIGGVILYQAVGSVSTDGHRSGTAP